MLFGAFAFSEIPYSEHSTGGIKDASATANCILANSLIGGRVTPASALVETTTGETSYIDIERVRLTPVEVNSVLVSTLSPERARNSSSAILTSLSVDGGDHQRVRESSQSTVASTSIAASVTRVRNDEGATSATAILSPSALRVVLRSAGITTSSSATSSQERIRLFDPSSSANLSLAASGSYIAQVALSIPTTSSTQAAGGYVKISSASVETIAIFLASAREKWEPIIDSGETWGTISTSPETWSDIAESSEEWSDIAIAPETWSALADSSETWTGLP